MHETLELIELSNSSARRLFMAGRGEKKGGLLVVLGLLPNDGSTPFSPSHGQNRNSCDRGYEAGLAAALPDVGLNDY